MTRPLPSPEDLVTLIQESLRNARELVEDARFLLGAGRAPRAHALAVLAREEIGKSHLCILASGLVPITGGSVFGLQNEGFWAAWSSHKAKLFWAGCFLETIIREPGGPIEPTIRRIGDEAHAENLRKLRGLYVDFADGAVLLPGEITLADAEELIGDVTLVLEVSENAWGGDQMRERALDLLSRPQELAELADRVSQALTADPEGTFATAREYFTDAFADVLPPAASGALE